MPKIKKKAADKFQKNLSFPSLVIGFILLLAMFLVIFFSRQSQDIRPRAVDYEKTCRLKWPPQGATCVNTGRTYTGLCQVMHCPKGCGNNQYCGFSDPGAYRTIVDCDKARLDPGECGQIDILDSTKKYCNPGLGYCDYKQIQCYSSCQGPEKPKEEKPVNPTTGNIAPSLPPVTKEPVKAFICQQTSVQGQIGVGSTFKITTIVRATDPAQTGPVSVIYHVERDGVQITSSGALNGVKIPKTTDRYQTSWAYTVPSDDQKAGFYNIWLDINGTPALSYVVNGQSSGILGAQTENRFNPLSFIGDLIRIILGIPPSRPAPLPPQVTPGYTLEGTITVLRPTGVNSLQLGTFNPAVNIAVSCDKITFTIL
ncbi:hypothetical protein A3D05_03690 [Candidatus Gottesmanbacteria bacterium RIFCSPHIGHO2_02_FULL_40_24]|uniref:Uncharacterized protein n=1 Tax=Candidatus Gottesmanbacteria bacterium RIFCSPHIGHO2_01_FULL_40_15 TaxID=1798376 RepID=A0A1F5Z199_9BACT|nr:MAG: hypothetical protein A2777_06575 [Candidatus Gottesmanbacteria bacterium RIFCSPHIGHO2_01_FULL_40_15]OGG16982.1 MAG: hypothetical protein A3D05_03690 [Candidatus Gottesmanbacteria bacterium RIFCSPHIGHO2_02_FULL_40_24]OGG20970.1 MAG: hypothetical protein A3B48_01395 [Candidatus Gottesmanbacteria bacterium RIFCSPLOWO2_01_FULL_40_10]OGG23370.1 MAG: hypothetical protein A3E42_03180 [Candidatus Gottesmanbacteria bacterium RIFCSPHIGHO2_12_FULL_40_13]OGG31773.1 MAG: hypothetical protein A3I80_0